MVFWNNKTKGFTLTEVLLAVAIIGIIAVLVLPATISKFDSNIMDNGFTRIEKTIQNVVDVLPVKENVADFSDTSMFSDGSKTMDESAGKFIKRYLRVAKYYGDATTNKELIKKECFADAYYEYSDKEKKEFAIDDLLNGACAKLKNGASICLSPQYGAGTHIDGVMDLNGPKGPNVYMRDLRPIKLSEVAYRTREAEVGGDPAEGVNTVDNPDLIGDGGTPDLCENDTSIDCCLYLNRELKITSPDHACCSNPAVASSISVCANEIVLKLNLWPASCNNNSSWCRVYVKASQTTARRDGKEVDIPVNPPDVLLFCDGKQVGSMSGSALASAIKSDSYNYDVYFTKTNNRNVMCGYQSGQGLKKTKSSVVFDKEGSSQKVHNGINWTLTYF